MNILVRDNSFTLLPFSINHASFEMKIGMFTNLERVEMLCDKSDKIYLEVNKDIEEIIRDKYPDYSVNHNNISNPFNLQGSIPYKNLDYTQKELLQLSNINTWGAVLKLNEQFLSYDFQNYECDQNYTKHDSVIFVNSEHIKINKDSCLKAGVIIDAEDGPVVIGKNVLIDLGGVESPGLAKVDTGSAEPFIKFFGITKQT